jgi:hypothetical protein
VAFPPPATLSTKSDVETEKLAAVEVPPPGEGFDTVTESVAVVATSVAGMDAVSAVALTKVVDRDFALKLTTELALKFEPLTESVNAGLPTATLVGEMLFKTGSGLLTVNVDAVEVPPFGAGFVTVTEKEPAAATLEAEIAAVSDVALMNVVGWGAPLKLITAPETKLEPLTDSVNAALPARALVGEIMLMLGGGDVGVAPAAFTAATASSNPKPSMLFGTGGEIPGSGTAVEVRKLRRFARTVAGLWPAVEPDIACRTSAAIPAA